MNTSEASWHGNGLTYRRRGARVWRIDGQGWFIGLTGSNKVRGPLSNALTAMEQADRMLAEAALQRSAAAA